MKLMAGQRLPFKRRWMQKTDYTARLALLKSGLPRLVVRRGHDNVHIQLVQYEASGDKTLIEEISRNIKKLGWKGHCGNLPASYLTGLLLGYKAVKVGIAHAVLDIGLQRSSKGSALYAAVKGVRDAGLDVSVDEKVLPVDERIKGGHIAKWSPKAADIVKNFEDVKARIQQGNFELHTTKVVK